MRFQKIDVKPAQRALSPQKTKEACLMLQLSDFDYHLPDELIAQNPADKRENSRLCVLQENGCIIDSSFSELADHIPKNALVILNNSKVFSSRLLGNLPSGGKAEIFLLSSPYCDKRDNQTKAVCLGRPMKKFTPGKKILFANNLEATIEDKYETNAGPRITVAFNKSTEDLFSWFEQYAKTPLPPYIKREKNSQLEQQDKERYQTVYAKDLGSVAAPTAGLHFTDEMFAKLKNKGVTIDFVTLHVGAGTFMPVKTEDISQHDMHSEIFSISSQTLNQIKKAKTEGRKIIAVGTTALRAIESLAELSNRDFEKAQKLCNSWQETSLFIRPKDEEDRHIPWIADAIITNFHQPKSTLFMLISALIGYKKARSYYNRAVDSRYRFFSYGDSNLLWF